MCNNPDFEKAEDAYSDKLEMRAKYIGELFRATQDAKMSPKLVIAQESQYNGHRERAGITFHKYRRGEWMDLPQTEMIS